MTEPIRVLHVDNDPQYPALTGDMLAKEDGQFTVDTADSASTALNRIADTDIDCVISDVEMPGMDGIEFLKAVRKDYPDLPFILFTGTGSEDVASRAISAGVTDYLQKDGGREQYTILANRITNAVERTRAQRERQRQLDAIETAQEGISILDEDGEFMFVNEAYADLYGYAPEEMHGEHWELIYRDEDVREVHEEILPTVSEQGQWRGHTTGLRADGTTFVEDHVLATTEQGELICTVRDVSDQAELREKFELVARASTDAFWEWDPESEVVTRNGSYLSQFGYDSSDVGEELEWWRERIHPDDRDRVLSALELAVDDPGTAYDETYRFRKRDGSYGYIRSRGYVVYNETGEPERMVGAHIDITDRKDYEHQLEQRNEELETFVSIVSHDLRNPLNVAAGRLAMAREDCDSPYLDAIAQAHERMDGLIEELLTLAREGEQVADVEWIDLPATVEACWRTVETADASLVIETDRTIRADLSRFKQLVENLLHNAVEHGGTDVTITIGDLSEGFYVADDGSGIPVDQHDEIFDYGYTTSKEGTGLGLPIIKQIADAHGWSISVTDSEAGGARFEITGVEFERD